MKIGILTFWWSEDNYGQILQCYALQKYLRDQGHDAYLIRYIWNNDIKATFLQKVLKGLNPKQLIKYLIRVFQKLKIANEQKLNTRHFSDFRNEYIIQSERLYNSYAELKKNPPEADIYIVGSDQVWRFGDRSLNRDMKKLHVFFLDFGDSSIRRMSYAASWGTTNLKADFIKEIKPLIKRFDFVSVREKNGIDLCKKCGINNAKWVPDPTLLLPADVYRSLYKKEIYKTIRKPYILLYMLKNDCNFNIQAVFDYAKKNDLNVVYITGNGIIDQYKKTFATIPEWLYLIDNSKYVVTNSFHCCVFSILFQKQFGVIPLSGRHVGMNSRIDSLFELMEIKERFITNNSFSILDEKYTVNYKVENFEIK